MLSFVTSCIQFSLFLQPLQHRSPRSVLLHFHKFAFTIVTKTTNVMRAQTSANTKRGATTLPALHRHTLGDTECTETATAHKGAHDDINRHIYPASASLAHENHRTENKHGSSKRASPAKSSRTSRTKIAPNHLPIAYQSQQLQQEPAIPLPRFCRIHACRACETGCCTCVLG